MPPSRRRPRPYQLAPASPRTFDHDPAQARLTRFEHQEELLGALRDRACPPQPGQELLIALATGGGKTRLANDWIGEDWIPRGKRVLWLARDWRLLEQAARDLAARFELGGRWIAKVGARGLRQLPEIRNAAITYTTLGTYANRPWLKRSRFDLVVIDEVHWGENKVLQKKIRRDHRRRATILGLTATPRAATTLELVGRAISFRELVDRGRLASPIVWDPVDTGTSWTPRLSSRSGDFSPSSLVDLGDDSTRNERIVETYRSHDFGKTIVFACGKDHAEELARRFRLAGVAADYLHSGMASAEAREVLDRFRRAPAGVLINVGMLTMGVDIPDTKTVFLARPTTSEILFAQMVGRGARLASGKDSFNVVLFNDRLLAHQEHLVRPEMLFGKETRERCPNRQRQRGPRLEQHEYEPAPIQILSGRPGYELLRGLEIQPQMTFGVELELTERSFVPGSAPSREWQEKGDGLLAALRDALGPGLVAAQAIPEYGLEANAHSRWNVSWDSTCGWEVTSRVLCGEAGCEEIVDACRALEGACSEFALTVNTRTGLHLHLGWKACARQLRSLFGTVAQVEPALLSLVAPSRFRNGHCQLVSERISELQTLRNLKDWRRSFADGESRTLAVNPTPLLDRGGLGTIEIRLHSGTYEAPKVLLWISLWMRILEAAHRGQQLSAEFRGQSPRLPLDPGPNGDIVAVASSLGCEAPMRAALAERRDHLLANSWAAPWCPHADQALSALAKWGA